MALRGVTVGGYPLPILGLAESQVIVVTDGATLSAVIDAEVIRIAIDTGPVWFTYGSAPVAEVASAGSHLLVGPTEMWLPWRNGHRVSVIAPSAIGTVMCISEAELA